MPDRHAMREAAQILIGTVDACEHAEVTEDAPLGGPILEATIYGDTIQPPVMNALSAYGLSLDPARSGTKGDPTHTVVVAR
jgi:hypothetical protein